VVIGAGDCPHCGGDAVFDLHGEADAPEPATEHEKPEGRPRGRLRRLLGL
jgi:hypothetical protein